MKSTISDDCHNHVLNSSMKADILALPFTMSDIEGENNIKKDTNDDKDTTSLVFKDEKNDDLNFITPIPTKSKNIPTISKIFTNNMKIKIPSINRNSTESVKFSTPALTSSPTIVTDHGAKLKVHRSGSVDIIVPEGITF